MKTMRRVSSNAMSMLRRPIVMVAMAFCLCALCLPSNSSASWNAPHLNEQALPLTAEEIEYLKTKRVFTIVGDPAWLPFEEILPDGSYVGMSVDFQKVLAARIGVAFELIPTKSWSESLEIAKRGESDLVSLLNESPDRKKYLDFTDSVYISPFVMIGKGAKLANGLDEVGERKLVVIRGYSATESVRRDYPDMEFVEVETTEEALLAVDRGEGFATVTTPVEATHFIRVNQLTDLKIVGETPYFNSLRFGVRKDDALLLSIMQKAVKSLTESDYTIIESKWISKDHDEGSLLTKPWVWAALLSIGAGLLVFWLLVTKIRKRPRY